MHISCNTPCLSPQILQNFCLISPGYYSHLKKNWRQCVYKMFGGQTRCITGDVQMEDRASSRLWVLAVIVGVKKDIKRDGWVSFFIICHYGKKTQSGIYNTTTSFLSSPSLHPCSKNKKQLKKPSLASVGLKPRLSLSVISTHKALSLVLYCLPILDAQTTLAYSFLPNPFIASNHPCSKKKLKKSLPLC